jgi:L-ascorbate metabolism protein UlaG (beta-lactamase superfamily)
MQNDEGVPLLGSKSLETLMNLHQIYGAVSVCDDTNRRFEFDTDARVTMIPSEHGKVVFGRVPYKGEIDATMTLPLKASDYKVGDVYNPLVEVCGKKILHLGSAGYKISELEGLSCDILLLCVPGWKRKEMYIETLISMLSPEIIMPIHFDDFTIEPDRDAGLKKLPFLDMGGFLKKIKTVFPETTVIIPEIYREYLF